MDAVAQQVTHKRARVVESLERLEIDEALQFISAPEVSGRPTGLREYNTLLSMCITAQSTAQSTATERMKVISFGAIAYRRARLFA